MRVSYSLPEVEEQPSAACPLRSEDASAFEKYKALAYSTAMKVPVAAIELYLDVRGTIEDHVRGFTEPTSDKLLPYLLPQEQHVFTLVLDLNETLVYSDWQRERMENFFKRPGVDAFLEHMAKFYEVVVYSDQPPMYVEPVFDRRTQGVPFHTGYQDRQLSTWMENIIGFVKVEQKP